MTVTAAASPIVLSAIVRYVESSKIVLKLSTFQWWTSLVVNGSIDQKAETNSATSARR